MNDRTGMQFIEQEHIIDKKPIVYVMANSAEGALVAQEKIERKGGMRLTNAMRQSIMEKVFTFKFKKEGDKLDKLELRLSHRAMVAVFGTKNLELLATIGYPYAGIALDNYGEPLTGEHLEAWRGRKITWRVGSQGHQYSMYVKDPLPPHLDTHSNAVRKVFVVKEGALSDEISAWYEACQKWLKEKRELEVKVNALLNSVTTFTSLQKTWPEGERFWKNLPIDFPFRNQVPAVQVADLNEALGI